MKFRCSTEINAHIDGVVSCFTKEDVMKESQDGFIRKEQLEGTPWAVGSKSRMYYKNLELTETVLINELPSQFKALYEHKHMVNSMHCTFSAISETKTRLDQEIHYTEFRGFVPKVMAKLFPSLFKKQVQKWLDQFKDVVEKRLE